MTVRRCSSGQILPVLAWMTGALISFVFVALAVRHLMAQFSVFEVGLIRTGTGLALLTLALLARPSLRAEVKASRPLAHVSRNLVHASGGIAWALAIAALPFATVFSIEFTAPAWVALLSFPLLGERVRMRALVGIALCAVGVLVVMRPDAGALNGSVFIALTAAFCFGLSILLTRRLALTESVFSILFWMMVWQALFYGIGILFAPGPEHAPASWSEATLVAISTLGVAGLCAQLCLSRALQVGEAITVVPLDFLRVPLVAVIGWAFYGEAISLSVAAGAAIIMAGIAYGLLPYRTARGTQPIVPVDAAIRLPRAAA